MMGQAAGNRPAGEFSKLPDAHPTNDGHGATVSVSTAATGASPRR